MADDPPSSSALSRRERQVLDLLIQHGRATAREIEQALPDAPTYSAVRSILRILAEKGLVQKTSKEGRDHYAPAVAPERARLQTLQQVVRNFFANSAVDAACALIGSRRRKLTQEEVIKLQQLIEDHQ